MYYRYSIGRSSMKSIIPEFAAVAFCLVAAFAAGIVELHWTEVPESDRQAPTSASTVFQDAEMSTAPAEHVAILSGSDGPMMWRSFEQMHVEYTQRFVESEGFGISRVRRIDDPGRRLLMVNAVPHRVQKIRLIGLMSHEAVVYESSVMQGETIARDHLHEYEQRALQAGEATAVSLLQDGAPHVWEKIQTEDGLERGTLTAGLRATTGCCECHDAEEGDLLGAFIYELRSTEEQNLTRLFF